MGAVITAIGVIWTMVGSVAFGVGLARRSNALLIQGVALGMFPGLVLVALGRIVAYLRILACEIVPQGQTEEPMADEFPPADPMPRRLVLVARSNSEQVPREKP